MSETAAAAVPRGVITSIDTSAYDGQLTAKKALMEGQFAEFDPPALEVFRSSPEHYRMRSEFTVWHDNDEVYYVMYEKDEATGEQRRVRLDTYPVASQLVNALMAAVMAAVRRTPALRRKLFQANFHTTLSGQAMVTLIYHRPLDEAWTEAARALRQELAAVPGAAAPPHVIGRSRKQRVCVEAAEVEEALEVAGRGTLRYTQVEAAFSQPNAGVCRAMLGWAVAATAGSTDHDLLELYCGNGNFTAAVAPNFRRVVATEVSKSSVAAARRNLEANGVGNAFVARMSSEEFVEAWRSGRAYHRLAGLDLKACDLRTLLVDPPRAGLDNETVQLVREFENVVYVSCNPQTLAHDLRAVRDAFRIERFAIFDQFPYTHHIECGVYLRRTEAGDAAAAAAAEGRAGAAAAEAAAGAEAPATGAAGGEEGTSPAVGVDDGAAPEEGVAAAAPASDAAEPAAAAGGEGGTAPDGAASGAGAAAGINGADAEVEGRVVGGRVGKRKAEEPPTL